MSNYLNDSTSVVVRKITEVAAPHISRNIKSGVESGVTAGKFMGPDSSFEAVVADNTAAVGVHAEGVPLFDYRQSYTIGTKISGNLDYKRVDLYEDNVTIKMTGANITLNNTPIWLSSGGSIQQDYPNEPGTIRQQVGWPLSTTEFVVNVQQASVVGRGGA